jgi:hypothetical protein
MPYKKKTQGGLQLLYGLRSRLFGVVSWWFTVEGKDQENSWAGKEQTWPFAKMNFANCKEITK